ncbi:hypothetical protein FLI92_33885, partial [Pseudomonas aeruginosa]
MKLLLPFENWKRQANICNAKFHPTYKQCAQRISLPYRATNSCAPANNRCREGKVSPAYLESPLGGQCHQPKLQPCPRQAPRSSQPPWPSG